jgi:hypothetical protein
LKDMSSKTDATDCGTLEVAKYPDRRTGGAPGGGSGQFRQRLPETSHDQRYPTGSGPQAVPRALEGQPHRRTFANRAGASLDDMIEATGRQAYTVRAAMSYGRNRKDKVNQQEHANLPLQINHRLYRISL